MKWALVAVVTLLQLCASAQAGACSLPLPREAIVLTIEGEIQECNSGTQADFDMAMLEALPKTIVKTENPWEPAEAIYEGVLLRELVDHVRASGTVLNIRALNDYHADLSIEDVKQYGVILAYKRNGQYMPVREKGPLFVVFPFSDVPSLVSEQRFAQSVWQVKKIIVE